MPPIWDDLPSGLPWWEQGESNASKIFHEAEGMGLPVDEVSAGKALDFLYHRKASKTQIDDYTRYVDMLAVIRTGGLFSFHIEDVAFSALGQMDRDTDLPPLPFPRTWFEIAGDARFCLFQDLDGHLSIFLGFAITEDVPSSEWNVYVPMLDFDIWAAGGSFEESFAVREYGLVKTDEGVTIRLGEQDAQYVDGNAWSSEQWKLLWHGVTLLPELLTQLLHTLGTSWHPAPPSRQVQRAFERKHGFPYPTLYKVQLGHEDDRGVGYSERVFHHRWLVRGHYRLNPSGSHNVPGKGICSWVRPYIKGPANAPWKGRPLYVSRTKGEHATA